MRLRAVRLKLGMTLGALAKRSGYSRAYVAAIEHGERPGTWISRGDISEALGCSRWFLETPVMVVQRKGPRVVGAPYLSGWEEVA